MRTRLKRLLARVGPGRALCRWYYDTVVDSYLISYPKCGRTWVRLMLAKVLVSHFRLKGDRDLIDVERLAGRHAAIPRIQVTHDGAPHQKRPDELGTDKRRYRAKKVIFLVRDPRDVIVSLYFQATRRDKYFQGDISSFIRHDRFGIETLLRYSSIWYENRHVPDGFLLVHYEDLQTDPFGQLRRIVRFLGLRSVSEDTLRDAVELASFDSMQRMEREGLLGSARLRPRDPSDPESYKVRRGKIGGYRDYLERRDTDYLNREIRAKLDDGLGYRMPPRIQQAGKNDAAAA
jgi:hypothetical protein